MLDKALETEGTLVPLPEIEAAADRIKPFVRRTPFIRARQEKAPLREGEVLLKLENLQATGAFKVRGAVNTILSLDMDTRQRGVVAASGGNHGIAVAYAAYRTGIPAQIFMPTIVHGEKTKQVERWGAKTVVAGQTWDDAQEEAQRVAADAGLLCIHPFADESVMAGQGTMGLEMLKQSSHCGVFVISMGGGGLISGVASAIKQIKPEARIVGVEPVGAPTISKSLEAGEPITLPSIDTEAVTLAPRRSHPRNLSIIQQLVDEVVLVTDDEMRHAAKWLWQEFGQAAELAGAASIAAVATGKVAAPDDESIGCVICGAGTDGLI